LKKVFYISILIIAFNGIVNAQITGQLVQYESEFQLAKVSLYGDSKYVESDFDGYFKIEVSDKTNSLDLIIDLN